MEVKHLRCNAYWPLQGRTWKPGSCTPCLQLIHFPTRIHSPSAQSWILNTLFMKGNWERGHSLSLCTVKSLIRGNRASPGVSLGWEAPRLGTEPRVFRGRGTGLRLAKRTSAPKPTSRLQSPAVAQPWASENAAPAPLKLLLPPPGRALWSGGGLRTLCRALEQRGPPQNAAPWPLGPQKVKRSPQGDHEVLLDSIVRNLERFRGPLHAGGGAAFCPVWEKPWRKGRAARGGGGVGEAAGRPRQTPEAMLPSVKLTAAPLGMRYQTARSPAQSALPP